MADFKVTIEIKDVGKGDVKGLVESILEEHGDNFDAQRGDFVVSASVKEHGSYFPYDWEEDEDG